jgi:hypothetical protein
MAAPGLKIIIRNFKNKKWVVPSGKVFVNLLVTNPTQRKQL